MLFKRFFKFLGPLYIDEYWNSSESILLQIWASEMEFNRTLVGNNYVKKQTSISMPTLQ